MSSSPPAPADAPASPSRSQATESTAAPASSSTPTPDPNRWWTLVAVSLGTFMLLVDITIINVALPNIQKELSASFSDLQWVIDAYALTLASLLLTTGSLADLYGRRKLYIVGLGVFTLASLVCGLSSSPLMLILARGSQGIGGAVMFSVSLALLASAFSGRERGIAFGVWGAITGLAVAIGPLLGGALTSGLSWRWIFFVNLPLGLIAIVLTRAKVTESLQRGARRPDWWGFITFTAALSALVFGLIRSGEKGWSDAQVIAPFVIAGVLLILFVAIEARGRHPMFDLSLFKLPTFVGGSLAAFTLSASLFAMQLYLVLYVQDVLGYTAFQTGLRFLVLSGGILVTSTAAGRLTSHVPIRLLIGPGLLLVGIGLLLMRRIDPGSDWTALIPGLFISGIGTGLVNPPLASTAVGVVEPARSGMASGINSTFRQVGIATGIATFGSLFASAVTNQVGKALSQSPPGFASGFSNAVKNGAAAQAIQSVPRPLQPFVQAVAKESFVYGLRQILLVGAVVALAGGVFGLLLVRRKDFVGASARAAGGGDAAPSGSSAASSEPAVESSAESSTLTPDAWQQAVQSSRLHEVTGADDAESSTQELPIAASAAEEDRAVDDSSLSGDQAADGSEVRWVLASPNGSADAGPAAAAGDGAGPEGRVHGRIEHTDGRPFAGVPITVTRDDGEPVATVTSAEDGSYEVPVEPGAYIVIASPQGCQPDAVRSYVPTGAVGEPADFALDGDGLLYGRVRGATGGVVTLLDADGTVVAGSQIESDGSYEIPGLRSGTYTATTLVPGTAPVAHQVQVLPGEAREHDLGLGPADLSEVYPDGTDAGGSNGVSEVSSLFSPGLHPVAMVRGGTGISGLPTSAGSAPAGSNASESGGSPTHAHTDGEHPADPSGGFASDPNRENN